VRKEVNKKYTKWLIGLIFSNIIEF